MTIHIDVGNSRIKIGYFKNRELVKKFIETKKLTAANVDRSSLAKICKEIKITNVFLCSVVPQKTLLITNFFQEHYTITPVVIDYTWTTQVKLAIDKSTEIGSDILALAAYALEKADDVIIVNMGTATTITHVSHQTINGVVILPGFSTALQALTHNSAKLENVVLNYSKQITIGKNTIDSISVGMFQGHKYMIQGFVQSINPKAFLLLSGGNSLVLAKFLPNFHYVEEATLLGIVALAQKRLK